MTRRLLLCLALALPLSAQTLFGPAKAFNANPSSSAAMRLDDAGRPLDESSIGLPLAAETVVWTGRHWIAIGTSGYVRINRDGVLVDQSVRRFDTPLQANTSPRVYARTFDAGMQPLGEYVLRYTPTRSAFLIGIPSDGNSALVLYEDNSNDASAPYAVYGARFDRAGPRGRAVRK